jgi:hypothetical protein
VHRLLCMHGPRRPYSQKQQNGTACYILSRRRRHTREIDTLLDWHVDQNLARYGVGVVIIPVPQKSKSVEMSDLYPEPQSYIKATTKSTQRSRFGRNEWSTGTQSNNYFTCQSNCQSRKLRLRKSNATKVSVQMRCYDQSSNNAKKETSLVLKQHAGCRVYIPSSNLEILYRLTALNA